MAHITRQTLGFYRESKNPVEVSLSGLLDDIVDLQLRRLELSKISLERRYSTELTIQGFPVELKQVFLNLIGNAVQAMPDGGKLRLHVFQPAGRREPSKEVCISICDTGTGIDSAKREAFVRAFLHHKVH